MEARLKQVRDFTNTLNGTQPMQNVGGGSGMNFSINNKLLTFLKIILVAMIAILILSCTTTPPKKPTKVALKLGTLRFDKEEVIFNEPAQTGVQSLETVVVEINNTSKTVPFEAVLVQDGTNQSFSMDGKCIDDGQVKSGTKKPNCAITFFFTPQQTGDNTATLKLTINKGEGKLEETAEIPINGQGTFEQGIKGLELFTAIADNESAMADRDYRQASDIPLTLPDTTETGKTAAKRIFMKVKNTNAASGAAVQFITKVTKGGSMFIIDNSTCTGNLVPNSECDVNIKFIPENDGKNEGAFALTSAGKILEQPLVATGKFPEPKPNKLVFSTELLTFPPIIQGMRSEPVTIKVTNTGTVAVTGLTQIPVNNGTAEKPWNWESFDTITTCPVGPNVSLAGGTSCTLQVTFWPIFVGNRTVGYPINNVIADGIMYKLFDTDIKINPITGLKKPADVATEVPNLTVSTSSHYFGKQLVNTTSASAVIKLTAKNGSVDVAVTPTMAPFKLTDDFDTVCKRENNRVRLGSGESCELRVVFNPTAAGSSNSTLTLSSGTGDSLRVFDIPLTGLGIIQTKALSFGRVYTTEPITKTFTFANSSNGLVKIGKVTIEGAQKTNFTMKQTTPAGESCIDKAGGQSVTNATPLDVFAGKPCTVDIGLKTETGTDTYKSEIVFFDDTNKEITRAQLSGTSKEKIFVEFTPKGVTTLYSQVAEGTIGINDNQIYVIGGYRAPNDQEAKDLTLTPDDLSQLNMMPYIYDIATNTWRKANAANINLAGVGTPIGNANQPYSGMWVDTGNPAGGDNTRGALSTALTSYDNKIFIVSGKAVPKSFTTTNLFSKYNVINQHDLTPTPGFSDGTMKSSVTTRAAINAGAPDMDRGRTAVTAVASKLYIFGGLYTTYGNIGWNGSAHNAKDRTYDMSKNNSILFADARQNNQAFLTRFDHVAANVDDFIYIYGGKKGGGSSNEMYVYRPSCETDTDGAIKFTKDNPSTQASYSVIGGTDLPVVANATAVGINSTVSNGFPIPGVVYYTGGGLDGLYQFEITRADLNDECSSVTAVWSKVNNTQTGIDPIKPSARLINVDGELWIHNGLKMLHYIAR